MGHRLLDAPDAAGVLLHGQSRPLNLARATLTAQLCDQLENLPQPGGANGMSFALQSTGRVHRDAAAEGCLAALGQLTAGLAHELRNPLGTIKASSEMLLDRLGPAAGPEDLPQELAGYISSEVDRANTLITRFLEFARPLKLRLSPVDLNALADLAIANLVRQDPSLAPRIHKNYDPTVPALQADPELLERVVFNLLRNAFDASPPGATVTIRTRAAHGVAELAVLDRGAGIPPESREQIFNPFFTTKPTGVGLGLAISSKIVDEHGGIIRVESEPGRGATFLVQLPIAPPQSL